MSTTVGQMVDKVARGIDYTLFEKILSNTDFTKKGMDAFQACQIVFEKTFMVYAMKFWEEQAECERLTERMIDKVRTIDELNERIKELETVITSLGGSIPESSNQKAEEYTIPLPLEM